MTPAEIAALRVAIAVRDDRPGTLPSLLARLERSWREAEQRRQEWLDRNRQVQRHGY